MSWTYWVWLCTLFAGAVYGVWAARVFVPHFDVVLFQEWSRAAQQFGYSNLGAVSSFNYLPPFVAVLWLSNLFESAFQSANWAVEFLIYWRYFVFALQLGLIAWLLSVVRPATTEKQRLWIVGLFLFHPVFMWVMWVWGQIDLLVIVPWIISLFYLARRNFWGFALASFLALFMKPTGILLLPAHLLFLLVTLMQGTKYRHHLTYGVFVILGVAIACLPLLPALTRFLTELQDSSTQATALTYNAYNIWFILPNYGPAQTQWFGLSYQMWSAIGLLIALLPFLHIFFRLFARKLTEQHMLVAYLSFAGIYSFLFTLLLTDMHERYWDFALSAFLVAALFYRPWRWFVLGVSLTFLLNFILIFPSNVPALISMQRYWVDWGKFISEVHLVLPFAAFAIFVQLYWRIKRGESFIGRAAK